MSRHRLGVALLLDPPLADEINGLRRALGDRSLGRIDAHITLVPPVNVRAAEVPDALDIVRRAAQRLDGPLSLTIGPPGSFLPANPVVHLPVGGDLAAARDLRDAVFTGPLVRSLRWPWVPHVTLADDADTGTIELAVATLRHFTADVAVERVVVLEERHGPGGRRWEPFADAELGPAVVVGRGGLDLTLVRGRVLDPAAGRLLGFDGGGQPAGMAPIVVSGVVHGQLVGVAAAWRSDAGGRIAVAVEADRRRSGFGRQLLAHTEAAVRAASWDCPVLLARGPAAFYAACSRWSVATTG